MARILPFASLAVGAPPQDAAADAPPSRRRMLIGDLLVRSGALAAENLATALTDQERQDQRLGRILVASRHISSDDLAAALSSQSGLGRVNLDETPPDPALLVGIDPYRCLEVEAVPWRQVGGTRVVVVANPDLAEEAFAACGGEQHRLALALATPEEIRRALIAGFRARLRDDARNRCPVDFSCRTWNPDRRRWVVRGSAGLVIAGVVAMPLVALQALMLWIMAANSATMALRLVALFARFNRQPAAPGGTTRLSDYKKLPRVSILVPLYREAAVARRLLDALNAMDYPAALLDIKLVLEEDDLVTPAAIAKADLPPTIEVVTVPADGLKTKPRAMNYALPFCRGDIVGIYDAEDRPDPGQIRAVVEHLAAAGPDVACVQGYLDFYNTSTNWLSRCFTIEYAIWFRVILLGVQRLGIPIPLGGTTVFFRRRVLETIGGWDAHNVTEDADLGMRLARFGYRCEMIPSITWEEANCRPGPWVKQRSRWLKGYAITWATHMRRPLTLWRDLGPRGFFGFQVLFLGAITSYLSMPLFWAVFLASAAFGLDFWSTFPGWLTTSFVASMVAGQVVMVLIAAIAARDAGRPGLMVWVLTLPFYWPLGALAAYRAIGEVFTRPFHWHKTEHGIGDLAEA